jgi:hypothetical protein
MAEEVGALRVDLSANAAQFEKDMNKARRSVATFSTGMESFGKTVQNVAKSVFSLRGALVAVAGATALGLLIKRAIETADGVAKAARAIGVTGEALQELRYAARLAGVPIEQFDKALSQFSVRVGEARNGIGSLTTAFKDSNPELLKAIQGANSVDQAFNIIADAANNAGDSLERNAILAAAFGARFGTRFASLVKGGAEAINQMRQEARDLGLVLDEVMLRQAEKANDQLDRMGQILSVNLTRALVTLSPQIIALGDAFIRHIAPFVEWLERQLPASSSSVKELERRIAALNVAIEELNNRFMRGGPLGARLIRRYTEEIAELNLLLEQRRDIEEIMRQEIEAGAEVQVDSIGKITSELQFELDQLGRTEIGQKLYTLAKKEGVEMNAQFIAQVQPLLIALEDERARLKAVEDAQKAATKATEERASRGKQVTDANRTAQEVYNETLEELSVLLVNGAIDFETFRRAGEKAREELESGGKSLKKTDDAARELGLTFTSAFEDAVVGGKKLSDVLRGLEQDLLRLFLRQTVTKPLLGALSGVFGGGDGGGGGLFGDLLPKFATGGNFTVGGVGGTDANVVAFKATRGEQVSVKTPGQQAATDDPGVALVANNNVSVIVNAPPGSTAETRETTGPGGRTIEVFIDETTAKLIGTPGSRTGRAMRTSFSNLQPQLRGRG